MGYFGKFKKNSIAKISFITSMGILLLFVSVIGFFWIDSIYNDFENDIDKLKEFYIEEKKTILKNEVDNLTDYLQFEISRANKKLKTTIKSRADNAITLANNIYNANINRDEKLIKEEIKNAIKSFSWRDGDNFIWIIDYDGNYVLLPRDRDSEGKNVLNFQDKNGKYVIKDEIDIIKTQGEGFFNYYFPRLNENSPVQYKKIGFVKDFGKFNWFFGTADFVDDVRAEVLDDALDRIANMRFDVNGYFFVLTKDAKSLVFDGEKINMDLKKHPEAKDFIDKILKIAEESPSGEFLEYKWHTLKDKVNMYPKITFIKYCSRFDMIVGAGIYLTDIESTINDRKIDLEKNLIQYIENIIIILIIVVLISLILFRILINTIENKVDNFITFFRELEIRNVKIDKKNLIFDEFKHLADSANNMAQKRERLEYELKRQKDFLSNVIDNSSSLIYVRDKYDKFILVNESLANLIGAEKNSLIGESVSELLPIKCIDTLENISEGLIKFKNRDIWFQLNEIELDSNLALVTLSDVTIRKNFESLLQLELKKKSDELIEQRADYKMMLDILPMSILYKDTKNTVLRANRKFLDSFGLKESEVEGKNAKIIFGHNYLYFDDLEVIKTKQAKLNILQDLKIDDKTYKFEVSKFPIIKNLDVVGILVTMLDITDKYELKLERDRQNELLIQQSKMAAMGEMIGAISHQWKQPLNGIYILIQALESDLVLDGVISKENGKEALDDMREQINFMFETMKEFRNFFKPSKDKKTFDIQNSILEVSKILKAQFLKYNIELQIEKSSIDLEYIGYENEFKQVILNILNNAKDVLISRKVPTIKISIDKSDNYINIYISDNGGGIPDDIIDKIFESYFSTKGENGTGIGLYMSKMIIENMDGKIEAFNIESGACFKISLKR